MGSNQSRPVRSSLRAANRAERKSKRTKVTNSIITTKEAAASVAGVSSTTTEQEENKLEAAGEANGSSVMTEQPACSDCTTTAKHGAADPKRNHHRRITTTSRRSRVSSATTTDSGYGSHGYYSSMIAATLDGFSWDEEDKQQALAATTCPPPYSDKPLDRDEVLDAMARSPSDADQISQDMFDRARAAEDDKTAVEIVRERCEDAAAARVWKAQCYLKGWGIDRPQPAYGFEQLKNLADQGCWQAFYPLAQCYLNGVEGCQPVDKRMAFQWFSTTAQLNHQSHAQQSVIALAQLQVGLMLTHDAHDNDEKLAFQWFLKSADNGNSRAQFIVGTSYELGWMVDKKDTEKAKEYLLKSATQGFSHAQASLGILLVNEHAYAEGLCWLETAVQKDNPRAMLKLGTMYEQGCCDVPQSEERALFYYKAAADRGQNPAAQFHLALKYQFGDLGLQQDSQLSLHYLRQSARAGYPPAQRLLGIHYLEISPLGSPQPDYPRNNKTALRLFRLAAAQGDVRAYILIGSCYENGRGVPTDYETALEYYRKAVESVSKRQSPFLLGQAQLAVAQLLHQMRRYAEAFEWFTRAASFQWTTTDDQERRRLIQSDPRWPPRRARLMLAIYHMHGLPGASSLDQRRAFEMLNALAQTSRQDGDAHYWLGACFEEGIPDVCEQDPRLAFEHYMVAAQAGHTNSEFQVALMLSNGQGVPMDRAAAFEWYERAASKRHKTALYSLGLYYHKGIPPASRDLTRARELFTQAAELGVVKAMESLASIYLSHSSRDDRREAVRWYRRAADRGSSLAQRELGKMHDAGSLGVAQDYAEAFRLFERAAAQKEAQATLLLGSYYQNGKNAVVEKDMDKALALYLEAGRLGAPVAPFAAGHAYHALNRFEEAYAQFKIAANDTRLANTRIGKVSKLMLARYILSYVPLNHDEGQEMTIPSVGKVTKQQAFQDLYRLATVDEFAPSFYWLADCYQHGNGTQVDMRQAAFWFQRAMEEANDLEAMVKMASMYEEGLGVPVNTAAAFELYKQSAERGHAEGQYRLGMAHWRGLYNLNVNKQEAVRWFTAAAQQRHGASHWALGQIGFENDDIEMAQRWWDKAAELGHAPSMRAQALLLLQMIATETLKEKGEQERNLGRALHLLANAVKAGDTDALVDLGRLHQAGTISASNQLLGMVNEEDDADELLERQQEEWIMAMQCFERAASMGHVEAMYLAAELWHAQQQYAAALEYYQQAADQGHLLSRVMRARYRLGGLGGIMADPEAGYQELLECAEMKNCVDAYNTLGQCHELGLGTEQSDRRAMEWYLQSAERTQDAEAMFRIGRMYAQGRIVGPRNGHLEAKKWFQYACQARNHARANFHLGLYYMHGIRDASSWLLPPDHALAARHFREAARQNDRDAMYELSRLLLPSRAKQEEVEEEGLAWLERAAQMGLVDAQREWGKFCHAGQLVAQDHAQAFDHFLRAAQRGDRTSMLFVGIYYEHGIHVAADERCAREWYGRAIDAAADQQNRWLAEFALAKLLHQRPETQAQAYKLFRDAYWHAPSGEPEPHAILAIMLARYQLHGWGGAPVHAQTSAQTLLRFAKQGRVCVYLDVAQCYDYGLGVPRNHAEALQWYERLWRLPQQLNPDDFDMLEEDIHRDIVTALYRLAEYYRLGLATPVDLRKADEFYKLACENASPLT